MPVIFTKDTYRASVEAASGGQQTVLYDDQGFPSVMNIIPKFNIEDVNSVLGSGVHPAFIVGGVEKSQIFVAAHVAAVASGRAISLPGQAPAVYVNCDQANTYCTSKGQGWHLMTNWEWAAIALWCAKNGFQPRGNTNWRRSHASTFETGTPTDGGDPGAAVGEGRTYTGSGPASWRHNNSFHGISDMVGNVAEWQGGMKLVDGQIYMPNDNSYDAAEADWIAQGVYFDASAGPGDRNGVAVSGTPILSNGISKYTETPTPAGGSDTGEFDYSFIDGAAGWKGIGIATAFDSLTLAKRQLVAQACISPKVASTDAAAHSDILGSIYVRNYGTSLPVRGGNWTGGANAGLGFLYLNYRRSLSGSLVGFRPAFIS